MQSFIKNLQQVDLTLHDEASRNWAEIAREDYMFDMKKRMVEKHFRFIFLLQIDTLDLPSVPNNLIGSLEVE